MKLSLKRCLYWIIGLCVSWLPNYAPATAMTQNATATLLEYNFDDLLQALADVESSNDPNAYNKREFAAGLYQIRPIYLKDVNRILGYPCFSLDDRYDPIRAAQMVFVYLSHYGRCMNIAFLARIHNGGPDAWRNDPKWFVKHREYTLEEAEQKIANVKSYWIKIHFRLTFNANEKKKVKAKVEAEAEAIVLNEKE